MEKKLSSVLLAVILVMTSILVLPTSAAAADNPIVLGSSTTIQTQRAALPTTVGNQSKFLLPIEPPTAGSIPISTPEELSDIRLGLNKKYHLVNDIDLSGIEWEPIGDYYLVNQKFTGTLDGQGYIINGLTIDTDGEFQGLFARISGQVKNIGFEGGSIKGSKAVGSLAGAGDTPTVFNCFNANPVIGTLSLAGGLIGSGGGKMAACYNIAPIEGANYVGGLTGSSSQTISDCYNDGKIAGCYRVGGLTGSSNHTIETSYNVGDISGQLYVGGLTGIFTGSSSNQTISDCYNVGLIKAIPDYSRSNQLAIGGIAGECSSKNVIRYCYNAGDVSTPAIAKISFFRIGGIVGVGYKNYDSMSLGSQVIGNSETNAISGYNLSGGCLRNLISDQLDCPTSINQGEVRPHADFYRQETYTDQGWDFETIWMMPADGGLPVFQWQPTVEQQPEPEEPEEPESPLEYGPVGFAFGNTKEDFGYQQPVEIPIEVFEAVYGQSELTNQLYTDLNQDWEGNCVGMAVTAGLLKHGWLQASDYGTGIEKSVDFAAPLGQTAPDLLRVIEIYQVASYSDQALTLFNEVNDDLNSILERMTNYQYNSTEPVLIFMSKTDKNDKVICGHAVLLVGCINTGEKYELLVYDPNYPYTSDSRYLQSLIISNTKDNWSYTNSFFLYHLKTKMLSHAFIYLILSKLPMAMVL